MPNIAVEKESVRGAQFTSWIGNVQILADSRSAITTAIVPFTPVTITATYSADSQDPAMATADAGVPRPLAMKWPKRITLLTTEELVRARA